MFQEPRKRLTFRHFCPPPGAITAGLASLALACLIPNAMANCPNDTPQSSFDANQNPPYLNICHGIPPGGGSCPEAPAPQFVSGDLAQEATVSVTIPSDRSNTREVHWQMDYQRPNGAWVLVSNFVSKEKAPHNAGETLTYGLTGMQPGRPHRVFVSLCDAQNCMCWSDPLHLTAGAFSGTAPAPPLAPVLEDTFTRPTTDPLCSTGGPTGDGIGPPEVWCNCQGQTDHSATIDQFCDTNGANCFTAARTTPSSGLRYTRNPARHKHTYAEAKVRVVNPNPDPGWKYNLQIGAWSQPGTMWNPTTKTYDYVNKSWNAKLIFGPRECSMFPVLMIAKLPNEYGLASCDDATGLPFLPGTACSTSIPLDQPDATYPGLSEPVWLRIDVREDLLFQPVITAKVGWGGCNDTDGIESCQNTCATAEWTGSYDSEMFAPGEWVISFHDFDYVVEFYRAGSEAVCADGYCDATEDCLTCSADCGSCP